MKLIAKINYVLTIVTLGSLILVPTMYVATSGWPWYITAPLALIEPWLVMGLINPPVLGVCDECQSKFTTRFRTLCRTCDYALKCKYR